MEQQKLPDFRELLEHELESTVKPKSDPNTATQEELVRDMHRVLAGNGGVTRGLLYKVAASNAQSKVLSAQVEAACAGLAEHRAHCAATHSKLDKEIGTADLLMFRRFSSVLTRNKGILLVVITMLLQLLLFGRLSLGQRSANDNIDRMQAVLDRLKVLVIEDIVESEPTQIEVQ